MATGYDKEFYGEAEGKVYPCYAVKEDGLFVTYCPLCHGDQLSLVVDEAKRIMRCRKCDGTLRIVAKQELMPTEPGIENEKKAARDRTKKKGPGEYQASSKKVKGKGEFVRKYIYTDPKGKAAHATLRWRKPKSFSQQHWDGKKWQTGLGKTKRYLYRLVELVKSKGLAIVNEGEKDANALAKWGLAATTAPMGAGKWKPEYNAWLKNRDVILLPDQNDRISPNLGIESMEKVAYSLIGIARSIKIVLLPQGDKKITGFDVSDWIEAGGTKEKLLALIEKTKEVQPKELEKKIAERVAKREEEPEKAARIITGKKFNPRPYSEYIMGKYQLKYDSQRRFWWYDPNEGIWKDSFALYLNDILRKEILKRGDLKRNRVVEILEDLKGLAYQEHVPPEPDFHLIPFKNKVYDLRDGRLLDFGPEYFFINKLNVNYDPKNKDCPRVQRIFEQIIPEEDIITLYEILAYCLFRGYPYPKAFMLFGGGANGKSTFARIMAKVLGRQNISSASLNTLEQSPFGTSQLYGKLANISPEMSYGILRSANVLKQLTGSDLVRGERKFKDPFEFENYCKLCFLSNEIPWSADKSFAFYRRIFLLEFPRRFEIAKRQEAIETSQLPGLKAPEKISADPFIIERIPQAEFEGLGYRCLEILKDLSSETRLFTFSRHKATEDVMIEYERISDPLGVFLEERTEADPEQNIPVRAFNEEFKKFQRKKGLRVWTDKLISKVMSQKGIVKRTVRLSTNIDGDYNYYKAYLELNWRTEKS